MQLSHPRSLIVAILATTALTACGGVKDLQDNLPDVPSPIQGVSTSDLQNNLDLKVDEQKATSSTVSVGYMGDNEYGNWTGRHPGAVTVNSGTAGTTQSAASASAPGVTIYIDADAQAGMSPGDGEYTLELDPAAYADGRITHETIQVSGNNDFIRVQNGEQFLYVPSAGSNARVGAIGYSDDIAAGGYSVFGQAAPADTISATRGTAQFRGVADATAHVNGEAGSLYDTGANRAVRAGSYRGSSFGTVDFADNSVVIDAELSNSNDNGMIVGLMGTLQPDGTLAGTSIVSGLRDDGESVSGDFRGQIFGSQGRDLGGTFIAGTGDFEDPSNPAVGVGGHVIMTQTN